MLNEGLRPTARRAARNRPQAKPNCVGRHPRERRDEIEIVAVAGRPVATQAGLVDEYHLLFAPIIAGSGNPYLPGKVPVKLELLDECRFANGMVHVRYRAKS